MEIPLTAEWDLLCNSIKRKAFYPQRGFQKHKFSERADMRVSVQTNQWFPDDRRDGFLERMVEPPGDAGSAYPVDLPEPTDYPEADL
jgi:hypothetical protein